MSYTGNISDSESPINDNVIQKIVPVCLSALFMAYMVKRILPLEENTPGVVTSGHF